MRLLFVDNFRGFNRQYIQLANINFLLGENSTGKSSILGLINMISSFKFWMRQDFNADEYQFGNFMDIASVCSSDLKSFRIGLIACSENNVSQQKSEVLMFLMEFHEKENVPVIYRYSFIDKTNAVHMYFNDKWIEYKIESVSFGDNPCETTKEMFESWLQKDKNDETMSKLKKSSNIFSLPIYAQMITLINEDKIKSKAESKADEVDISLKFTMPDFSQGLAWLAPIRSKPKRTYDQYKMDFSPEGDHTPYLVQKILDRKRSATTEKFRRLVKKYGEDSGMLKDIEAKKFGKSNSSPFELRIKIEDKPLNIANVGYGVSQSLPIVVELFARTKGSWFAIQQPEVHLHPRAQAALGEIFYELASQENKKFFIETHSDFIIDRFRLRVNKNKKSLDSQVIFFVQEKGFNKAYPIKIMDNGKYEDNLPDSFRTFFIREELSILGIR